MNNTARETIDETARDVFNLDGKKGLYHKFKKHPRGLANWLASLDETVNKRKASLRSNNENNLKKQKTGGKVNMNTLVSTCHATFTQGTKILYLF